MVCAFLNRDGGHLLLCIEDKGGVIGIAPEANESLSVEEVEIDGLVYIFVPES